VLRWRLWTISHCLHLRLQLMLLSRGPHRIPKPENCRRKVCYYFSLGLCPLSRLSIYVLQMNSCFSVSCWHPPSLFSILAVLTLTQTNSTWAYYPAQMDGWSAVLQTCSISDTPVSIEFEFSHLSAWWRHDEMVQRFERKKHDRSDLRDATPEYRYNGHFKANRSRKTTC